jgi:hypothetical protein
MSGGIARRQTLKTNSYWIDVTTGSFAKARAAEGELSTVRLRSPWNHARHRPA